MFSKDVVDYLILLTAQEDRLHLISHLIGAIHKVLDPGVVRFLDIFPATDPETQDQHHLIFEPLDPIGIPLSSNTLKGLDLCIEKASWHTESLTSPYTARLLLPIVRKQQVESILFIDTATPESIDHTILKRFLTVFKNLEDLLRTKDQDPLTNLLNRRSFDETITHILNEYSRQDRSNRQPASGACLAVLDIDHFKRVNDSFGHAIGDEVLILFAQTMRQSFRLRDRLYRFGGEEFLVILTEVNHRKAVQALERFRQAIESYHFPQVEHVTVSVGAVMINQEDYPSDLIEKADKALYFAKEHGRNQVHTYDHLIEANKITKINHVSDDIELWV
ncbi:GGDEF domain-containing protein [Magnetococcales bacterium HHB-1]